MREPDLDELVGDVGAREREELRRAHEALLAAGPPPELPPHLARARGPAPAELVTLRSRFPRRRLSASVVLAAALTLAAFAAGYFVHSPAETNRAPFRTDFTLAMRGTEVAPDASAGLVVGVKDRAGNWPMVMTVAGLPALAGGERYELFLTRDGRAAESCGTFVVEGETTVVYLNAPYRLRRYDGWAVAREGSDELLLRTRRI